MVQLSEFVGYCDDLLAAEGFRDYCPNGLQVAGRPEVRRLVTGVTASLALLERAVAARADTVLVHHGYFWKGESPRVVGMKARRLRLLLRNDVSLVAYHLPLDAHPELGNNVQLADRLGIGVEGRVEAGGVSGLLFHGALPEPVSAEAFGRRLGEVLGRAPLHVGAGPATVHRVAWCTGAAQGFLPDAAALGVDAYISGEVSERTTHEARESEIHYYGAGHHATERYGVEALGNHLAAHFGIVHDFIDVDNPA